MRGFIDKNGNYYEADKNITGATEVPKRPDDDHVFTNGAWVARTLSLDEVKARERAQVERQAGARMDRVENAMRRMTVLLAEAKPVPAALLAKVKKNDLIEDARDAALLAIDAAATKTAARAVAPAVVWP